MMLNAAPPAQDQVEVCVVEDHPLYRAALMRSLREAPWVRPGVAAGSVEEFLAYRAPSGGVVVLDLGLPGACGPAAVLRLVEEGWRVLVVSAHASRTDVLAAIAAGARGYLTKDSEADDVLRAVRCVANGDTFISPTLASFLLDSADRSGTGLSRNGPRLVLSDREREILGLLAAGERDVDIARALTISIRTVRSHLDRIRDKTGRRRRPELTRLAIELGVMPRGRPARGRPAPAGVAASVGER